MKIQRLFLLLSVTILLLAGCGGKETQVTEEQSLETETQTAIDESEVISEESEAEESVTEEPEPETAEESEPEESASAEDSRSEDSGSKEQPSTEQKPEQEAQQPDEKPNEVAQPQPPQQEPEQQAEKEPEQPSQPEPVSYSPERVVQLATEKTKANGKIYIPDDLDRMLAEGTLTQEDYNACYPTDGAGYLEYYVATDLNEARDISGTVNFNSEDDIAANIAGMYNSLPQQYFYIEYHGTVTYGGKECYVFYCYRA
ncbi:MAG: hypothetical protein J6D08_18050 [Lachnospiraceae bacterium]|nr:hypothetical protein [Lachnospiraceae bacterium]